MLTGGFILPLVLYLVANERERPETRWHAREALNFQLTFMLVHLASFVVLFASSAIGRLASASDDPVGPGIGFGVGLGAFFLLAIGSYIANIVGSIVGALRAKDNERWKYPVRIPFVKG